MTDLIKREDALALVDQWFYTDDYLYSIILDNINNLPIVDPATLTSNSVDDNKTVNPVVNDHIADVGKMADPAAIRDAALREAAAVAARYNVNRGQGSATARAITTAIFVLIGEKK